MVDSSFVSSSKTSDKAEFSITIEPSGIGSTIISFSVVAPVLPLLEEHLMQKTCVSSSLAFGFSFSGQKATWN
jgi:hypothetical protein